ncbi:MAG: SDR family NAD(P)-dependent oxidoreductase [bacterium]
MSAKVAIVTGGGRRLGKQIALALAREGCDLFVTFRASEAGAHATVTEARELGRRAHAMRADLRAARDCRAAAAAALALFGGADILINNAALFPTESIDELSPESWDQVARLNLLAPILLTRALAPALAARHGAVVNIGSVGGRIPYRRHIAYSLSKSALAHATRALARRYAPAVRVNSLAPAGIAFADDDPNGPRDEAPLPPLGRVPLGRHATPEEITSAVVFLATRAPYMTGQTVFVDGGRSIA